MTTKNEKREKNKMLKRQVDTILTLLGQASTRPLLLNNTATMASSSPHEAGTAGTTKTQAPDGKVYFSYADVHSSVSRLAPKLQSEFQPDVMIAIGGGGFIPARILRSELKIPIVAVSLELYDDATNTIRASGVTIHQWFSTESGPGKLVNGGNVLIVDEVDDSRTTLQYCVEEVLKTSKPKKLGVVVVHNKLKDKKGVLPDDVAYYAGENVPDKWNCYPWDAAAYGRSIDSHETLARQCSSASTGSADEAK